MMSAISKAALILLLAILIMHALPRPQASPPPGPHAAERASRLASNVTASSSSSSSPPIYIKQDVVRTEFSDGKCGCPNPGHTLDPVTGMCKCAESPFLDPKSCATRKSGLYTAHEDAENPVTSFIDPTDGPARRCQERGGTLAEIHDDLDTASVHAAIHPGVDYFVNARRSPEDKQFRWQSKPNTLVDDPNSTFRPNVVLDKDDVSAASHVCLVVRRDGGSDSPLEMRPSPCSATQGAVKGYLCESGAHPSCRNDALDDTNDCRTCKNPNYKPNPSTTLCDLSNPHVHPAWKANQKTPPYEAMPNKVSGQLEFLRKKRTEEHADGFMPEMHHMSLNPGQSLDRCAERCTELGRTGKFDCQGFVYTGDTFGDGSLVRTLKPNTCVFFNDKTGLDDPVPNASLSTYVMQYCKESNRQYWPESAASCTQFIGMNAPDGSCLNHYKDATQCMPRTECASSGSRSVADCSVHPETGEETCGDCTPNDCIDGVDTDVPGCNRCAVKFAKGDFTGNMRECDQCPGVEEGRFQPLAPGDNACKCVNPHLDPASNCEKCVETRGGDSCQYTRATNCNGLGRPDQTSATLETLKCNCDASVQIGNEVFPMFIDGEKGMEEDGGPLLGVKCTRCKPGADGKSYGPEPGEGVQYPCTVRTSHCDHKAQGLHEAPAGNPVKSLLNANSSLIKLQAESNPADKSHACDCSALNAAMPFENSQALRPDGNNPPGHWGGDRCDACDPAFGGQHCNILSSAACHERGTSGPTGVDSADPKCTCEGNFRSWQDSTEGGRCADRDCKDGWFGLGCDVPDTACGVFGWTGAGKEEPRKVPVDPLTRNMADLMCQCRQVSAPVPLGVAGTALVPAEREVELAPGFKSRCECPDGHRIRIASDGISAYCEKVLLCSNASSGNLNFDKNCVCNRKEVDGSHASWTKSDKEEDCLFPTDRTFPPHGRPMGTWGLKWVKRGDPMGSDYGVNTLPYEKTAANTCRERGQTLLMPLSMRVTNTWLRAGTTAHDAKQRGECPHARKGGQRHVCGGYVLENGRGNFFVADPNNDVDDWLKNPRNYDDLEPTAGKYERHWGYACGGAISPCNTDDPDACDRFRKNPSVWPGWSAIRKPNYGSLYNVRHTAKAFWEVVYLKRTVSVMMKQNVDALAAQIALKLCNWDIRKAGEYIGEIRANREGRLVPRYRKYHNTSGTSTFLSRKYWDVIKYGEVRTHDPLTASAWVPAGHADARPTATYRVVSIREAPEESRNGNSGEEEEDTPARPTAAWVDAHRAAAMRRLVQRSRGGRGRGGR